MLTVVVFLEKYCKIHFIYKRTTPRTIS